MLIKLTPPETDASVRGLSLRLDRLEDSLEAADWPVIRRSGDVVLRPVRQSEGRRR